VPNREIAKSTIINLNRPQRLHAVRIPFLLDYAAPPTRAKSVLLHAASNAKGVAAEPKPKVYLNNFGEYGIQYEIKFWLEDHDQYYEVCDSIRSNVWYGLHRHGIKIPFPTQTLHLERPPRDRHQELQAAARLMLRQQPLFKCLSDDQLDFLLPRGRVAHFGSGETLIQQGDEGNSMFILVEGKASVLVNRNGAAKPVAQLNSGDCFGEMSLLTGEPRMATVVAQTDCELVEIGKSVLAESIKQNPKLLEQLSELLARRQLETDFVLKSNPQTDGATEARQNNYAAGFLGKLRQFFEI
jgi:CRP-like cAMP-binding protein